MKTKMTEWIESIKLFTENIIKDEIMLFPFGEFSHSKYGKIKFDKKFFQTIIDNFKNKVLGTFPFMDSEHDMGKALAWFNTEPYIKENEGLFAKPEWTELGKKLISEKVYMYFSPWYEDFKSPEGKEYKEVWRGGAATNIPFLKMMPAMSIQLSELGSDEAGASSDEGNTQKPNKNIKENKMGLLQKLAEMLGLDSAKATEEEVIQKIEAMKAPKQEAPKPDEAMKKAFADSKASEKMLSEKVTLAETKLSDTEKKLSEAVKKLVEQEMETVVGKAMSESKILPKDKEFYQAKYLANPADTKEFIEKLQPSVTFGEMGSPVGNPALAKTLDDMAKEIISKDSKKNYAEAIMLARIANPEAALKYDESFGIPRRTK